MVTEQPEGSIGVVGDKGEVLLFLERIAESNSGEAVSGIGVVEGQPALPLGYLLREVLSLGLDELEASLEGLDLLCLEFGWPATLPGVLHSIVECLGELLQDRFKGG